MAHAGCNQEVDHMETILIVDDSGMNLRMAKAALENEYQIVVCNSGALALRYLEGHVPDLILLDVKMPDMDGFETIRAIKQMPQVKSVPVIFLTADVENADEVEGLRLGAVDYIHKPFEIEIMRSRIRTHIDLYRYRTNLQEIIREKTEQIERVEEALVASLSDLQETRDGQTGGHAKRTARYFEMLLDALYEHGTFPEIITEDYIKRVKRGALLHDIGKVGIADATLLKDAKLSDQEMEYMRQHTKLGGKALDNAIRALGEASFLDDARDLAYYHHEKWNGTGYPEGLSGEEIPLGARILSVADVYDALTSKRSYKEPFSHEKAVQIILEDEGKAFDPRIIAVFREIEKDFEKACRE